MSVIIRENFLPADEVAMVLHGAKTLNTWDHRAEGDWKSRVAHADHIEDPALKDKLVDIRKRVRAEITRAYRLSEPLYSDTLQIVRWPEGFEQHPHADAENPDGLLHPYHWRSYASLIYLNNDFTGGEIYFPRLRLEPLIQPGMLVFFPGTLQYLHGVSKVTRGERYTIASFWTFDSRKQDVMPI